MRFLVQRYFDADYAELARLRDGTPVQLRLVRASDKELVRKGFARLSPESRYLRFFAPKDHLTERELSYLTELDGEHHLAIGAERVPTGADGPEGLGVARFIRLADDPAVAEAAVAVLDELHGQGLGTLLLMRLMAAARERGVRRFRCEVLAENTSMIDLLTGLVEHHTRSADGGVVTLELELPDTAPAADASTAPRESPIYRLFRMAAEGMLEWRAAIATMAERRRSGDVAEADPAAAGPDLGALLDQVRADPESHPAGPCPPAALDALEAELGVRLPPSYRAFMTSLGAGEYRFARVYAIDGAHAHLHDLREHYQLALRHDPRVGPGKLLPFADEYSGDYYYFDLAAADAAGEAPVLLWPDWADQPEQHFPGFDAFVRAGLLDD